MQSSPQAFEFRLVGTPLSPLPCQVLRDSGPWDQGDPRSPVRAWPSVCFGGSSTRPGTTDYTSPSPRRETGFKNEVGQQEGKEPLVWMLKAGRALEFIFLGVGMLLMASRRLSLYLEDAY